MRLTHTMAVMAALLLASTTLTHAQWDSEWTPMKDTMINRRSVDNSAATAADEQQQGQVEGRNYAVHEPTYSNDTDINTVIDQIINSRREGRVLGEFDQVYADGNIDQALQLGNDMQARNLIRDKLCGLGLMSCDVEEKRPYYSTIYAQGPPPPQGFGGGPYGPAKPMPPPRQFNSRPPPPPPPSSLNSFGPPRKVGYEVPYKPNYRPSGSGPVYNGPYLENPPQSAIDGSAGTIYTKPPPGAIIYGSKPPGPIFTGNNDVPPPYNFENPEKIQAAGSQQNNFYTQQSSQSLASASASKIVVGNVGAGLQQHVHHHYHHVEGSDGPDKIPNVPIPIGNGQTINTDFSSLAQSSTAFTPQTQGGFTQSNAFNAGFNGASQGGLLTQVAPNGFAPALKPNGDLYKPAGGLGSYTGSNGFSQTGFGQSSGSYHSQNPDYYKKELHTTGGIAATNNLNSISTGYGDGGLYQNGYDTARQQIVDCQCVPINQCPAADRIGRKEDLILPIDPRNLGKEIEALSDEAAANITTPAHVDAEHSTDEKKRTRREIKAEDKQSDDASDLSLDSEGRQGLPALQAIELIQRKILPTYGVSFGLPYPNHGYPTNALGENYPAQNPYFGSIGPNGLNLGLVNVNPLVSVQVSKTEYGDKVVKPLVNLHVTPNANILEKVGNLFKRKPSGIHNTHYHHHDHYASGFQYGHDHHDHQSHYENYHGGVSNPTGPIFEYPPSGPSTIVEMVPSKPIFEYHSSNAVPPHPIHAPAHQYNQFYENQQQYGIPSNTGFGTSSIYPGASGPALGAYQSGDGFGQGPDVSGFGGSGYGGYNGAYNGANNAGYNGGYDTGYNNYERSANTSQPLNFDGPKAPSKYEEFVVSDNRRGKQLNLNAGIYQVPAQAPGAAQGSAHISFPRDRRRRSVEEHEDAGEHKESVLARTARMEQRAYYGNRPVEKTCRINEVCCRRPFRPQQPQQQQQLGRCGTRNAAGITGRIKNPVYVDGDSEFGEYPWHVAILKKDPKESIYACGATLIDAQHVITAAHCIKSQNGFDLRARLGEWDVNHDVEFFPYIERDVVSVHIHPEYYAGTLDNDLAVLKLDHPVDFTKNPHISPACLPDKFSDFTGARCWTTGWGKDAFGEHGKYQNILKEVDVPILSHHQCEQQLRQTRLGYSYKLNPGFVCAGGEEGKDACKGDGGGPLVCDRNGIWNVVGVVSWGIGCGQVNVPGVYVRVAHYLDWIRQITDYYK